MQAAADDNVDAFDADISKSDKKDCDSMTLCADAVLTAFAELF